MDELVVWRVKTRWAVAWLGVTGFVLAGWGLQAAAAASLAFVGASLLSVVAYLLNLLLGEAHVAVRILLILLFFVGMLVEVWGIASMLG